ncbi:MAG: asparagine synthetase B, partial [Acetobacter sp.]|nr:asparagine synthetase B [Acetobacter sp.]
MRLRHGKGKWLLRQWLAQHNPAARPFAPKQGFTVPIGQWIMEESRFLADLLPAQACIAEIADPNAVRSFLRSMRHPRETAAAWNLLFYALWHRAHIRALPPVEPLFEALL